MTSLPKRRLPSGDVDGAPIPVLNAVPVEASETRPWRDRVLRTSHADISLRETTGTKLPILLLHGGGLCKDVFAGQLESGLGAQHRMIAIDWPGHGASSDAFKPDRTYRIEGLADLAIEVLERLGIDGAVVVGASLGGRVGLEMIQMYPDLIGLALTGTPLGSSVSASSVDLPEFALAGEDERTDERIDAFLRHSLGHVDRVAFAAAARRADPRAIDLILRDIRSNELPWPTPASVVSTPILAVNGEKGPVTNTAREAGGQRAQTRFSIPQGGPAPFLEAPAVFNHLLERFMQRMVRREKQLLASPPLWYGG